MSNPLATVTIAIQDRKPPLGPSIAVSITPHPATIVDSSAVKLWVLIRAHINSLIQNKADHEKLQAKTKPRPATRPTTVRRTPHRASAKGTAGRLRESR
jgi:hypothetical protein